MYTLCVLVLAAVASAAPEVAFPFNSQVPTVARVGVPYEFQLSASTFAPESGNFSFGLVGQPAWLSLNSATRTLFGMPGYANAGPSVFTIVAEDANGQALMGCTLVVSTDPPPQLEGSISSQLAAHNNLSSASPASITLLPGTAFHVTFNPGSFIDLVKRNLTYYATLSDHTPLPSWIAFDVEGLSFSGTTPEPSAFPQSFDIDFIASDVVGFAGAVAPFSIMISEKQLVFVPQEQTLRATVGTSLNFSALQDQLFLDGTHASLSELQTAMATLPSWLTFDSATLEIAGIPPPGAQSQVVVVTVTDKLGDTASSTLHITFGNASLFSGTIGVLTAKAGQDFNYTIPMSVFSEPDVAVSMDLGPAADWLHFDAGTLNLEGVVPSDAQPTSIHATMTATAINPPATNMQSFGIDVEARTMVTTSTSSPLTTGALLTNSSSPSSAGASNNDRTSHRHLSGGAIAGAVVGSLLGAAFLLALLILCCRRWQRQRQDDYSRTSPSKKSISRPIVTTDVYQEYSAGPPVIEAEKSSTVEAGEPQRYTGDSAPKLALNLPPNSARQSRAITRLSRISAVSSLGEGEAALLADPNFLENGRESEVLHRAHDSFSVPAEIARSSRMLQMSPTKRGSQQFREHRRSQKSESNGLGIETGSLLPRHSSKRARHSRTASSLGLSATNDRSSLMSAETRSTGVLSTSTSRWPQPPSSRTGSRSIPAISILEPDKRKSIRLVDRSDSGTDDRSIAEKRHSWVRNRASAGVPSPFLAHGSRASSKMRRRSGIQSMMDVGDSRSSSGLGRGRHGRSYLSSYSQSSSLEGHVRNPRRLSDKIGSAIAPGFPRVVTRSSMGGPDQHISEDDESSWTSTSVSTRSISDRDVVEEPPDVFEDEEQIQADNERLQSELTKPRNQRPWVLPGEASPTPPLLTPESRNGSTRRGITPPTDKELARQKWAQRLEGKSKGSVARSSSPLSTAVAVPLADRHSLNASGRANQARRSRLSLLGDPASLISHDSLSGARRERPRLVHTSSQRPLSVEEVKRLSSPKVETTDAVAGSEQYEDLIEGAGLLVIEPGNDAGATQRSTMSGRAFI